jgi:hypothetical protein
MISWKVKKKRVLRGDKEAAAAGAGTEDRYGHIHCATSSYPEADVADADAGLHGKHKVSLARRAPDDKGALGRRCEVTVRPRLGPLEPTPRLAIDFDLRGGDAKEHVREQKRRDNVRGRAKGETGVLCEKQRGRSEGETIKPNQKRLRKRKGANKAEIDLGIAKGRSMARNASGLQVREGERAQQQREIFAHGFLFLKSHSQSQIHRERRR